MVEGEMVLQLRAVVETHDKRDCEGISSFFIGMDWGYGKLPRLPLSEINLIYEFVLRHRDVIDEFEISILQKLMEIYQEERTLEARQNLKTFLLYLRRCVNPTPAPKILPREKPRYSLQSNYDTTPVRRPEVKFRRRNKVVCHCHTCEASVPLTLSPSQDYRISRRSLVVIFRDAMRIRRFIHTNPRRLIKNKTGIDSQLRANEHSIVVNEGAITRVDVSQLAANRPIEDYHSSAKCLSSNACYFGVFDGHAGASCSRHVSARLFDYMCSSVLEKHEIASVPIQKRLQWLFSSGDHRLPHFIKEQHQRNVMKYFERFKSNPDLTTVRKALQTAFVALDEDISSGALPDAVGKVDRIGTNIAASGSCAVVAHVRRRHLHVANIGDSAAVLGVNQHNSVTARQLSRPHCVDNDDEVQRIRAQHPISESGSILKGGRLLGELYPLRAFGDVRYKWTENLQRVVLEPLGIPSPPGLLTPPYLTALPEVFYHRLTPNDKFLVLASDGLWEWLDPDTVVRLIHDHTLGTQTLSVYQPQQGLTIKEVCNELERRKQGESKKPIDDNSATHVIRNALGGASGGAALQYERLKESLQLPPGMARHYRDDITVIVIHFKEEYLSSSTDSDDMCGF